jgi:hypothetical protein
MRELIFGKFGHQSFQPALIIPSRVWLSTFLLLRFVSDSLEFDAQRRVGQLMYGDGRASRRRARKIPVVYFIEVAEIVHVCKEARKIDDILEARSLFGQNGPKILDGALSLDSHVEVGRSRRVRSGTLDRVVGLAGTDPSYE